MPQEEQPPTAGQSASEPEPAPNPLEGLRSYLKNHPEGLIGRIKLLRQQPFFSGGVPWAPTQTEQDAIAKHGTGTSASQPSTKGSTQEQDISDTSKGDGKEEKNAKELLSRNSLEEASKKVALKAYLDRAWGRWPSLGISLLLGISSFCLLCLLIWLIFITVSPASPVTKNISSSQLSHAREPLPPSLDFIAGFAESLTPPAIVKLGPRLACIGLSLVSLVVCFWLLFIQKFPLHEPDPLFDRMLQDRSPSPVSKFTVTNILGDPRFRYVFQRAQDTAFPLIDEPGADVDRFIDRLIDHLDPDGQCARFFTNHGVAALKGAGGTLHDRLEYEIREMLFAEVFDDPAFVYIYKRNQPKWRRALAWFLAFDFERAMKLFRSGSSSREKPDKMQMAALGLLVILVLLVLNQPRTREKDCNPCSAGDKPSSLTLAHFDQLDELIGSIKELIQKLATTPTPPGPSPLPPIHIELPPYPAPNVNVPITIPNLGNPDPEKPTNTVTNLNPNFSPGSGTGKILQGTGEASRSLGGSSLTNNVIVSPASQAPDRSINPPPTIGGDDFAIFTYTKSDLPLKLGPFLSNETLLILHTAKGEACTYKARIAAESLSPPDPVSIMIVSADSRNSDACEPKIAKLTAPSPGNANLITATGTPSYSELLHAYVSVAAFHRNRLPPFAKKDLVLKIHYEAMPRG